jgi:hypothetical protein
MLNDIHAACVAIAVAVCLKKENNRRWIKELYKRRPQHTHTHENLVRHLRLSEPNDYKMFLRLDVLSFNELIEIFTPTIGKE